LGAVGPVPAALAAAVVVTTPFACARLGASLGDELRGSLDARAVAVAIVAGPALAGAVVGMALAVSLPGRPALGAQIAAAPYRNWAAVVASCVVPVLGGLVLVVPPLLAFDVAFAEALNGEGSVGVALAFATLTAVPAGAIVAETALAASRGARRRAVLVGLAALAWVALGQLLGGAPLGPLAPAARALREEMPGSEASVIAAVSLVVLVCGWVRLAAVRPVGRRVRRPRTVRLVRGAAGSVPGALVALIVRKGEVRLASAGALAFGVGGVALARLTAAPAPAGFMLGTTTALLGSVVASLVVSGVLRDGRWLWVGAPYSSRGIAFTAWLVALAVTLAPVVLVGLGAFVLETPSRSAVAAVAVVAVMAADAALVAGVLVPWSRGAGDQLTTFSAFGAVAIATSLVVGLVAPRLVELGVPNAVLAVGFCAVAGTAAVYGLGRGLERARP